MPYFIFFHIVLQELHSKQSSPLSLFKNSVKQKAAAFHLIFFKRSGLVFTIENMSRKRAFKFLNRRR